VRFERTLGINHWLERSTINWGAATQPTGQDCAICRLETISGRVLPLASISSASRQGPPPVGNVQQLVGFVLGPYAPRLRESKAAHPKIHMTTGHMWLNFFKGLK